MINLKIIDGNNLIYGRLSAHVAKELLNGEEIVVVNADKVAVTGSKEFVLGKFRARRDIGSVRKGPHYPRTSNQILRRSIGEMLPTKKTRGEEALGRCRVFSGVPMEFNGQTMETIEEAKNDRVSRFVTLHDVAMFLGGRY